MAILEVYVEVKLPETKKETTEKFFLTDSFMGPLPSIWSPLNNRKIFIQLPTKTSSKTTGCFMKERPDDEERKRWRVK